MIMLNRDFERLLMMGVFSLVCSGVLWGRGGLQCLVLGGDIVFSFFGVGVIGDGKRRHRGPWSSSYFRFMSHLQTDQNVCIYVLYCMFWG